MKKRLVAMPTSSPAWFLLHPSSFILPEVPRAVADELLRLVGQSRHLAAAAAAAARAVLGGAGRPRRAGRRRAGAGQQHDRPRPHLADARLRAAPRLAAPGVPGRLR